MLYDDESELNLADKIMLHIFRSEYYAEIMG